MAGWMGRARCAEADPETFFPAIGGSALEAKRLCAGCEVRTPCLETALDRNEWHGVWGGYSPNERRTLRRAATFRSSRSSSRSGRRS